MLLLGMGHAICLLIYSAALAVVLATNGTSDPIMLHRKARCLPGKVPIQLAPSRLSHFLLPNGVQPNSIVPSFSVGII